MQEVPEGGIKFLLRISLGNGMQDGRDIAGALRQIAAEIEDEGPFEEPMITDTILVKGIWDDNGQNVGQWTVKALSAEQFTRQAAW